MPLTREFRETVLARIKRDRRYRKELLREGVECLLAGDLDTGKAILRDYINATIGFEKLSRLTKLPAKSLMRMLGPNGNPQARNLFEVIGHLQRIEGLHFQLSMKAAS
jgi:DNA-binding phage protein